MTQPPLRAYLSALHPRSSELNALNSLKQPERRKIIALVKSEGNVADTFDNISRILTTNHQVCLCVDLGDIVNSQLVTGIRNQLSTHPMPADCGICVPLDTQPRDFNSIVSALNPSFTAIRIQLDNRQVPHALQQNLKALKAQAEEQEKSISLILDLGYIHGHDDEADTGSSCANEADVQITISLCAKLLSILTAGNLIGEFYQIFILGGSFPRQITFVPDTVQNPPVGRIQSTAMAFHFRREYTIWKQVRNQYGTVLYGDYSVFHPKLSLNPYGRPSPNIRYAQDDRWILLRGKSTNTYHPGTGFYTLSNQLISSGITDAPTFSEGDKQYAEAAKFDNPSAVQAKKPPHSTGGGSKWLEWSSSHHLAYVVRQLSNSYVI